MKNEMIPKAQLAALKRDRKRLQWLMAFIQAKGSNGIATMNWTVVDPTEVMEDRFDLTFDRACIDAAMKAEK